MYIYAIAYRFSVSMTSFLTARYLNSDSATLKSAVRNLLRPSRVEDKVRIELSKPSRVEPLSSSISSLEEKISMEPVFLRFLELDIEQNSQRLQPVTSDLLAQIDALVGDEDIDIDAPLLPEDDD